MCNDQQFSCQIIGKCSGNGRNVDGTTYENEQTERRITEGTWLRILRVIYDLYPYGLKDKCNGTIRTNNGNTVNV